MSQSSDYKYLDLLSRPLDESQKACCVSEGNTIVAAGAGSGKTQVLATRFAWLVMSKEIPASRILTLTFTKKAAAEMYQRIYQTLSFFSSCPETPAKEKALAKKALDEFSDVHIQTLDSYCASVVKAAASRYGIKPDFNSASGGDNDIYMAAVLFIMERLEDPVIKELLKGGDIENVAKSIFIDIIQTYTSVATEDDFFEKYISVQNKKLSDIWNENIKKLPSLINDLFRAIEEKPLNPGTDYEKAFEKAKQLTPDCLKGAWFGAEAETGPIMLSLSDFESGLNVTKATSVYNWLDALNFDQTKKGYNEIVRAAIAPLRSKDSKGRGEIPEKIMNVAPYIIEAEKLKHIASLFSEFMFIVNRKKRVSGNLSFKDIVELTLKILRENSEIREQEASSFDKIMIDEFQDNNEENKELLFLLSKDKKGDIDKNKLFFVGDDKQSIYKFRGADVEVFNRLSEDLKIKPLHMSNNYRSNRSLLEAFNYIFGYYKGTGLNAKDLRLEKPEGECNSLFPQHKTAMYEADFPIESAAEFPKAKEKTEIKDESPHVHFCIFNTNISEENLKDFGAETPEEISCMQDFNLQESYFIANKIHELHNQGIPYSKIAVLDRSTTNRNVLKAALSRLSIPYEADRQSNIFEEAPVNDVLSFFRLCVYPSDIMSFAVFLASPFTGLSEREVENVIAFFQVQANYNSENQMRPVAFKIPGMTDEELCNKLSDFLCENSVEKFIAAKKFFEELSSFALYNPLTETLTKLWYQSGYKFETMWNKPVSAFNELYDFLFETARVCDEGGNTVAWFVDQLESIKYSSASSDNDSELDLSKIEYQVEKKDAVQLMTIHKSKGLQFHTVFVTGLFPYKDITIKQGNATFSKEYGLIYNLPGCKNPFFNETVEIEKSKEKAEFLRVAYVGFTRAEENLYVTGRIDFVSRKVFSVLENFCITKINSLSEEESKRFYEWKSVSIPEGKITFEMYKPVLPETIYHSEMKGRGNSIEEKLSFIKSASQLYDKAKIIGKFDDKLKAFSPSQLERYDEDSDGKHASDPYPEIKDAVESTFRLVWKKNEDTGEVTQVKAYDFGYNDFGTLAHDYMENLVRYLSEGKLLQFENYLPPFEMTAFLSEEHRKNVISACRKMAAEFQKKSLWNLIENATLLKPELSFMADVFGYKVNGSIDLLLCDKDGVFHIIDYKTDLDKKDGSLDEEKYYLQLSCYRRAASFLIRQITGKDINEEEIQCSLYFLRYGKQVDITKKIPALTEDLIEGMIAELQQ